MYNELAPHISSLQSAHCFYRKDSYGLMAKYHLLTPVSLALLPLLDAVPSAITPGSNKFRMISEFLGNHKETGEREQRGWDRKCTRKVGKGFALRGLKYAVG